MAQGAPWWCLLTLLLHQFEIVGRHLPVPILNELILDLLPFEQRRQGFAKRASIPPPDVDTRALPLPAWAGCHARPRAKPSSLDG